MATRTINDYDKITDGLYVGAVEALLDHKSELKERVGAVVSLLSSSEFNSLKLGTLKKEFKHLWIEIDDMPSCDLKQHFKKAFKFIDKGLKKGVLIHCWAGQSRSPSLIIAYLMYKKNLTFQQAISLVQTGRAGIEPGFFSSQIKSYFDTGVTEKKK
jgi:protein-tyrosine phosphatase